MTSKAEFDQIEAQHGGRVSEPVVVDPEIDNPDPDAGKLGIPKKIPNPNPIREYIFRDGTSLKMRWTPGRDDEDYQIVDQGTALKPPTQQSQGPTDRFPYTVYNDDGSKTIYQVGKDPKTGGFGVITDIPPEKVPSTTKVPSDPGDWKPIHANPSDPTSRVVALLDPKTGNTQVVSQDATPNRPQIIQGQNGELISWDGTNLVTQRQAKAAPKAGDTINDVVQGKNVQKTYDGSEWHVTKILGDADPNALPSGATRSNIVGGYNVTQTKSDGDWTTTSVNGRAYPSDPTAISAPANQPNIVTMQDGKISSQPSPNFIPKTPGEINARIGQIAQIARAKQDELLGKVGKNGYTADQSVNDWKAWYAQNVGPEVQALNNAQDNAAIEAARAGATNRAATYQTGINAQQQAIAAYKAMVDSRVGPGFAQADAAAGRGDFKALGQVPNAVTFQAPDIQQTSQQALMDALKYISPTAAQVTGTPQPDYARVDINQALGMDQYLPRFGTAGGAAQPAPAAPGTADNGIRFLDLGGQQPLKVETLPFNPSSQEQAQLLPAGYAGMPGFDPRYQGRLNPNLYGLYQPDEFPDPSMLGTYSYGR